MLLTEDSEPGEEGAPDMLGFARRDQWQKNKDWKNDEFWFLCKEGIPTALRARVYSDVLKRKKYEVETRRRNDNQIHLDASMSIYENIRVDVMAHDCLGYRQIEEDVVAFQGFNGSRVAFDTVAVKNVLKSFVRWQHIYGMHFSYSLNYVGLVQRLMTIMTEEDAFWVFVALQDNLLLHNQIMQSVTFSRAGVFRHEMLTLHALVKFHLPKVYEKLEQLGLPVNCIYDKLTSFFADAFPSELVLRLWDLIFLEVSSATTDGKKRTLWLLLATAYYLFYVNEKEILQLSLIHI